MGEGLVRIAKLLPKLDPNIPYGVPPLLSHSERDTIPRNNIQATSYYKNVGIFLGGCLTGGAI